MFASLNVISFYGKSVIGLVRAPRKSDASHVEMWEVLWFIASILVVAAVIGGDN